MGGDDGSEVSQVAKEVDNLLSRSKYVEALQCALRDPPFAAKDQALKDTHAATVLKALSSPPDSDMEKIVSSLYSTGDPTLCDNLMKYIYRGLEQARFSGVLLKWHAQVVATAGLGPIVRAMADRKTV